MKKKVIKLLDQRSSDSMIGMKLIGLLREYFNLRIQLKSRQLKRLHLMKRMRHNIAIIKGSMCIKHKK